VRPRRDRGVEARNTSVAPTAVSESPTTPRRRLNRAITLMIGKLAGGPTAGLCYVDHVSSGPEDYYAGKDAGGGQWIGSGAARVR
jgi:hypothetical protein